MLNILVRIITAGLKVIWREATVACLHVPSQ